MFSNLFIYYSIINYQISIFDQFFSLKIKKIAKSGQLRKNRDFFFYHGIINPNINYRNIDSNIVKNDESILGKSDIYVAQNDSDSTMT